MATCDSGVLTWPVKNNAGFLAALLRHEDVTSARVDTGFIAQRLDDLVAGAELSDPLLEMGAINVAKQSGVTNAALAPGKYGGELSEVWYDLLGFRMGAPANKTMWLLADGQPRSIELGSTRLGVGAIVTHDGDDLVIVDQGWPHRFASFRAGGVAAGAAADGAILSPMPGRVIAVEVAAGDAVTKGQKLVTLEAMKMEHSLVAPFDGTVAELNAQAGGQVSEGTVLARVEKAEA